MTQWAALAGSLSEVFLAESAASQAMLEDELKPLARAIAKLLRQTEAYGRVAVDLWMQAAI